MEWVSLHCCWEGNACWTLTTAWTMARGPQFIILLSGVLYTFPLKTVSSSILIIPWCCTYFVLVKMPSSIWADSLKSLLEAFSVLSTVKCIMSKDIQHYFILKGSVSPLIWSHEVDQIRPPCHRWFFAQCNPLSSPFTTSLSSFLLCQCPIDIPLDLTCSCSSPSSCSCVMSSWSTFLYIQIRPIVSSPR